MKRAKSALLESSIRVRDDAEKAANDWQSAMNQLGGLQQKIVELQTVIAALRQKREETSAKADSLRGSLASVRARHSTLTQVLNDHSYTGESVQKLFAANERNGGKDFRAVGVLADYAEVQEQHEAAFEQYMRDELEYVVVETYDHARAGVSCCAMKWADAPPSLSIRCATSTGRVRAHRTFPLGRWRDFAAR